MANIKKLWLTGGILALLIFCCSRCMQPGVSRSQDPRGEAYAGSQTAIDRDPVADLVRTHYIAVYR
ncbi:MAG TPA: hypothetical protein VGS79_03875 [Puia sp.]|nr:hypothetical protein [Puia sp.]